MFVDLDKFDFQLPLVPTTLLLLALVAIGANTLDDLVVFNIEMSDMVIIFKP